ncbi:MAG: hypothetical protein M3350_10075 [Actinomycetota bacterium]|nr:hypothetical protein [Actinomycetota bacterium]
MHLKKLRTTLSPRRFRPTFGTAIALVALFVTMSGTAVALPGKNRVDSNDPKRGSIGTRAIANNSVRSSDIRNGNVFGADINDGSLTGDDVRDDSLNGNDVNESQLGKVPNAAAADNATNAQNAANAQKVGTNGVDTAAIQPYAVKGVRIALPVRRTGASVIIGANGQVATATASCGGGERLIGGGPEYHGTFPASTTPFPGGTVDSYPMDHQQWRARAYNGTGTNRSFQVWVLCIPNA